MLIALRVGHIITPIRHINPIMASNRNHASENAMIGGGIMPGAEMRIAEFSTNPGAMWVRVELPGRDPVAHLKMTGEEYTYNFRLIRYDE